MSAEATPNRGPLAGLKVVELGQLIAGPFAAKTLADFGAEVIKIEPPANGDRPGGDPLRQWRLLHAGTSVWWQVQSRNKLSVALDLKDEASRSVVRKLIDEADVLVENFKPGVMEAWGFGYDALSATNPGLVMLRISGYGQTGPYKDRPGFGVVAEAMGGLRHLTAEPGRVPVRVRVRVGVSIGDTLASLHGVIGILMALQHRHASVSTDAPKGRSTWPCTRPSAQRGRGARCAERGERAGRAHLHRARHRRRPALPGARHAPACHHGRWAGPRRARHRAQTEPDAGGHHAPRPHAR